MLVVDLQLIGIEIFTDCQIMSGKVKNQEKPELSLQLL